MAIIKSGGKWLKASEINNNEQVLIVSEVKLEELPDFNDKEKTIKAWVGVVQFRGSEYKMKFTKSTRTSMIEKFGNDTINWVSKKMFLTKIPTPSGYFSIWGQPVEETQEEKQWSE